MVSASTRSVIRLRVCLLAIVLAVAGFLTLGLPGIPILYVAALLTKSLGAAELGGDQVWPAVLAISVIGPFALVPADLFGARLATSRWVRVSSTIAVALVIDVLATGVGLLLSS